MRVIVMFDLPLTTIKQQRAYRTFRKWLIKSGFIMMQQSIYSKVMLNPTAAKFLVMQIKNNSADEGLIQVMTITESQYAGIECIVGNSTSEVVSDMRRLVIL
jgi:CRISPR-associated protein Cas2